MLPEQAIEHIAQLDTALLAMVALGLTTDIKAIRRAGLKPLMLASLVFA
ncbi:MAG: putative sulfate exporter family transporter [Pseudomonas sp.]